MLNISDNKIDRAFNFKELSTFHRLSLLKKSARPIWFVLLLTLIALACMFLPWTQNVSAKGYVTTRLPSQKPQAIQTVISGQLSQWYIMEGDFVEKGDTIAHITEVKSDYFDPNLIARTDEQVKAKSNSVISYNEKIIALQNQYQALQEAQILKLAQLDNKILQSQAKVRMDSIDLLAYRQSIAIAKNQLDRTQTLYDKGLKTLSELQEKELKLQQTQAKLNVQENKLTNARSELLNTAIQKQSIIQEYTDKLSKTQSEIETARSSKFDATASTSKLQNELKNYEKRQTFYYITAPQTGYITKIISKGIGEIIKEGKDIATIMPADYELMIELYVKPQELPLISVGNIARIRFDGWPAIVISGWPAQSTGVFTGKIYSIDQFISDNGYYRVLILPEESEKPWPATLRVGTGTETFIMLKDVPIWYEVWRQLNGFPPDFYREGDRKDNLKRKAPLKSVK